MSTWRTRQMFEKYVYISNACNNIGYIGKLFCFFCKPPSIGIGISLQNRHRSSKSCIGRAFSFTLHIEILLNPLIVLLFSKLCWETSLNCWSICLHSICLSVIKMQQPSTNALQGQKLRLAAVQLLQGFKSCSRTPYITAWHLLNTGKLLACLSPQATKSAQYDL